MTDGEMINFFNGAENGGNMGLQQIAIILIAITFMIVGTSANAAQVVPFVGCPTNVNGGDINDAPSGNSVSVDLNSPILSKLSYYEMNSWINVFAPKSWNCFAGQLHDEGAAIYVIPNHSGSPSVHDFGVKISGPIVFEEGFSSDTVCWAAIPLIKLTARYFPKIPTGSDTVIQWINGCNDRFGLSSPSKEIEAEARFPAYQFDIIKYKNNNMLEFETPPNQDGLGTWSNISLNKSNLPIYGVLYVNTYGSGQSAQIEAFLFEVRLPTKLNYLRQSLIGLAESEIPKEPFGQ